MFRAKLEDEVRTFFVEKYVTTGYSPNFRDVDATKLSC